MTTSHIPLRHSAPPLIALLIALLGPFGAETSRAAESELEWDLEAGVGYDSNAFLTPDDPYFDQIRSENVDPKTTSGIYVPFDFGTTYTRGSKARFIIDLDLDGRYYPEEETDNANEYEFDVAGGVEWVLAKRGVRENTFRILPRVGYDKRIFFDRDTGLATLTETADFSDRYTYSTWGIEIAYRNRLVSFGEYEIELTFDQRDYEDIEGISSLDQSYAELEGEIELDLSRRFKLVLEAEYGVRSYDDRPARDEEGRLLTSNPALEYRYLEGGPTVKIDATRDWTLYFDYTFRSRSDEFVDYNSYTQERWRVRAIWSVERFRFRAEAGHRDRTYDEAFIFDNPIDPRDGAPNPNKAYEIRDLDLSLETRIARGLVVFVDAEYRDQETADPRYLYERSLVAAGLRWRD